MWEVLVPVFLVWLLELNQRNKALRDIHSQAFAAPHIARILILSYFVALVFGLIEGAELSRLTAPFLSEPDASYVMGGVVVSLAALVLFGLLRRPAALILSLVLFFASYLTMFATGDLTGFWRDLALIGGLLLTAGVGQGWAVERRAEEMEAPEKDAVVMHPHVQKIVSEPQRLPEAPRRRTISRFREDLNLAREA